MDDVKQLLVSVPNAMRLTDLSRSTLYLLMKRGELKFVTIGGVRRIPHAELERLAREGAAPATSTVIA